MSLNFPASPTVGQQSTQNGRIYSWTGTVWEFVASAGNGDERWDYFKPDAPTAVTATASNAQIILSWTAPTVLAQTPITNYTVEYTPSGGSAATVDTGSVATSYTLTGLTNGTSHSVRVRAVNVVGNGDYSAVATGTPNSFSPTAVVLTSGSSYAVPAGSTSMKVWAIGGGGSFSNSCDGGSNHSGSNASVAVKTYNISGGSITYSIAGSQIYDCDRHGSPASSTTITYSGVSVVGGGGVAGTNDPNQNQGCTNATTCGTAGVNVDGLNAAVTLANGNISGRGIGATLFQGNGGTGAAVFYFT